MIVLIAGLALGILLGAGAAFWVVAQYASWLTRRQATVERQLRHADRRVSYEFWRARQAMESARRQRNLAG